MTPEPYELRQSVNAESARMEVVLRFLRPSKPSEIAIPLEDWQNILMDQVTAWAHMYPKHFASHGGFSDLKKAIDAAEN